MFLNVSVLNTLKDPSRDEGHLSNNALVFLSNKKALNYRADLDPIYYCEVIKLCPIFDNGDCKITDFEVSPKSGPQGECTA